MSTSEDLILQVLAGRTPEGGDLAGVTLDGKRLPRRERVVPWALGGVSLRGAVLTRLDLRDADFRGSDLSGAAFRNVNLERADFSEAVVGGAIFDDVNLAYAKFLDADLRGAAFSFANLADVSFKGADMRGASVNAARLTMNGGTHTLGMKEALRHRYRRVSYPFVAGVSGDAFDLAYLIESGSMEWGGFVRETFDRCMAACGFSTDFLNESDVEEAWRRLTTELAEGNGVVTPVHIGGACVTGSAFGGSAWVYVCDFDRRRDAVRVRCLLGDEIWLGWDEFIRSWCVRHPETSAGGEIVYSLCVMRNRVEEVEEGEAVLRGIRSAVGILEGGEKPEFGAVCGIPVYDFLLRDLEVDPLMDEEGCAWLGPGVRHHHGSRWAVRDFLVEASEKYLVEAEKPLGRAIELYQGVMDDLARVIRIMPAGLNDHDGDASRFIENREEAARCLRSARAAETEALAALAESALYGRPR